MIIALASPRPARTLEEALSNVEQLQSDAAARSAEIVCFPEAYIPGLRATDIDVYDFTREDHDRALRSVQESSRRHRIATIIGMERIVDEGRQIVSYVIDASGHLQGYQTKNQIDPSEDPFYIPGSTRQLFDVNGVKFGVAICHEGWRYPETVRWAAVRGAAIVFHPHHGGSNTEGVVLSQWGAADAPYYEKAMMMRSRENTIYFASVNYALRFQESATSLIAPSGECQAYMPYGTEGVLIAEIDVARATGLLARRYAPERYEEARE